MSAIRPDRYAPAEPASDACAPARQPYQETGDRKVIAVNLCGHGHFDMQAYRAFLDGQLVNFEYPQAKVDAALAEVPQVG